MAGIWKRAVLCAGLAAACLACDAPLYAQGATAIPAQPAPPAQTPDQLKALDLYRKWFPAPSSEEKVKSLQEAATLDPLNPQYLMAFESAKAEWAAKQAADKEASNKAREDSEGKAQRAKLQASANSKLLEGREAKLGGDLTQARKSFDAAMRDAQVAKDDQLISTVQGDIDALDADIARDKQFRRLLLTAVAAAIAATVAIIVWLKRRKRTLVMVEGPERGRIFKLEKELTTIGAVQADWIVDDPYRKLSRLHCQIARSGRHFFVMDCSRNGTFLNGRAIPKGEPILLRANDEITLCDDVILIFR